MLVLVEPRDTHRHLFAGMTAVQLLSDDDAKIAARALQGAAESQQLDVEFQGSAAPRVMVPSAPTVLYRHRRILSLL